MSEFTPTVLDRTAQSQTAKIHTIDALRSRNIGPTTELGQKPLAKAAGFLDRTIGAIVDRFPDGKSKKKLALFAAAASFVTACGGTATESTTSVTPPTTIESTTTTTLPPTTTTTTEAPTTTTEAEYPNNLPADIAQPTGEIVDQETGNLIKLGFVEFKGSTYVDKNGVSTELGESSYLFSGRIARAYFKPSENPQGEIEDYLFIDLVSANGPYIVPVKLSPRNGTFEEGQKSLNWFSSEIPGIRETYSTEAYKEKLDKLIKLRPYPQIVIEVPSVLPDFVINNISQQCDVSQNKEQCYNGLNKFIEFTERNNKILQKIPKDETDNAVLTVSDDYISNIFFLTLYPVPNSS